MAGSVIQATGRPDFEDGSRTGTTVKVIYDTHSVRTKAVVKLAEPLGRANGGSVPLGAAEQAKEPAASSGGFGLREGPKSYPAMFHAILGINLVL